MEKLVKKLRSKRGDALVTTLLLFFLLMFITAFVLESARLLIIRKGVREMVTQAVTAGGAHNLYNAYDGVREENSATWDKPQKTAHWAEAVNTEDVSARMVSLFSMKQEGQVLQKMAGGKLEFALEGITVKAQNPMVGSRGKPEITYEITYDLLLPWTWEELPPMRFSMRQESIYRPKF